MKKRWSKEEDRGGKEGAEEEEKDRKSWSKEEENGGKAVAEDVEKSVKAVAKRRVMAEKR